MRRPRAAAALLALLAGCAANTPAPPAALAAADVAPRAPQLPARLLASDVERIAMTGSPDVLLARAAAARGAGDARLAAQRPNPVATLFPDRVIAGAAQGSPWTVAAILLFTVLRPGENRERQAVRAATTEAVRLDVGQAAWRARGLAVTAFRDAALARRAAALAGEQRALDAERVAAADRLTRAGAIGQADRAIVLDAAVASANAAALRRSNAARAEAALAAALGAPRASLTTTQIDWPDAGAPPEAPLPDTIADAAVFNRLDVQAALGRWRAAEANYRAVARVAGPLIQPGPAYTYDKGTHRIGFTLNAELPIYHRYGARVGAARSAADEAREAVNRTMAVAVAAAVGARADYAARLAEWRAAAAPLRIAETEAERAERALDEGSGDRPTLFAARSRVAAARLARLDALQRAATAAAALEDATQRPFWPATSAVAGAAR
ncbi:MAG: TolC family protein [Sphingomonadaceae bacterium]|nr:TolC family protein [Sphingomonadaceae bacterium]